jgi:hypothetical protein
VASMEELKVEQRVLYKPASLNDAFPAVPCRVVRKLDQKHHAGTRVDVYMPMLGRVERVMVTSLRVPRTCSGCGCIDEWGCDGGCCWVADDLCSACAHDPAKVKTAA